MIEIPIINQTYQEFTITLHNVVCDFIISYNTISKFWSFDLRVNNDWVILGKRILDNIELLAPIRVEGLTALIVTKVNENSNLPLNRETFVNGEYVLSYVEAQDLELING